MLLHSMFSRVRVDMIPGYVAPIAYSWVDAAVRNLHYMQREDNNNLFSQYRVKYQRGEGFTGTSIEARRDYLHAHKPDGSIEWWVHLADSDLIENAVPHIRSGVRRVVELIQGPAAWHPQVPDAWWYAAPADIKAFGIKNYNRN